MFDPLGFISPIIIVAKILMQHIWAKGLDWDEPMVGYLESDITRWMEDLGNLDLIKVDRCLCPDSNTDQRLHVFCDASKDGYATVAYLTCVGGNESMYEL